MAQTIPGLEITVKAMSPRDYRKECNKAASAIRRIGKAVEKRERGEVMDQQTLNELAVRVADTALEVQDAADEARPVIRSREFALQSLERVSKAIDANNAAIASYRAAKASAEQVK